MQQALPSRRRFCVVFLAMVVAPFATVLALAAETIPPVPRDHFNDYADVVSATVERQLNDRLAAFERANSSQVVVAIFPRMQSTSPVKDYTLRVARAWGVGRKDRDNGVVLFAFMEERQLYLQIGAGLESRIPDSLAQQIVDRRIVPRFRARDIDDGLRDGVDAILAAIRADVSPGVAAAAAAQIPIEASSPSPRYAPPATNPPPSSTIQFSGGGRGRGAGVLGFFGFFGFVFLASAIAILAVAIRAIGGNGANHYDSATPRTPPPLFSGHRPGNSHRPRPGGFGAFGGLGGRSSSSRGSGSFSRGGGGFRGGGAGGKW